VKLLADDGAFDEAAVEREPSGAEQLHEVLIERQPALLNVLPFHLMFVAVLFLQFANACGEVPATLPGHPERAKPVVASPVHSRLIGGHEPADDSLGGIASSRWTISVRRPHCKTINTGHDLEVFPPNWRGRMATHRNKRRRAENDRAVPLPTFSILLGPGV
jgi:hypothetical protein